MRPFATLIVTAVMALGAIGLAVAAPGRQSLPDVQLESASGALSIANSRAGQAVFGANAMRPGADVSGTVELTNDGDLAGRLTLDATGVNDTPGPNGGLLSERLELVVEDVTGAQQPATVFTGTPDELELVDLGTLASGATRSFRFTATLDPATDDRYQGSSLALGFAWTATAAAPTPPAPPAPDAPPPIRPDATPVPPPTSTDLSDVLGLPTATSCIKKGKVTIRLKAPSGTRLVAATVKANGRTKAKFKGSKARRAIKLGGLGKKPVKLAVTVKASNGKTYTATRTYKPCK